MNSDKSKITDEILHRFVDGELQAAEAREVGERVAGDEALRRKVDRYREINRRLREAYDVEEPVPARLLLAASTRPGMPLGRVAAAVSWLLVGGIIGFFIHDRYAASDYVRPLTVEAAYAHAVYVPEIRHPVEVNADEREHLNAWLSKRLNRPIAAPDLRAAGYALIGGRLLPDAHRPAAQFMFEDEAGGRITLYVRHALDARKTSFRHAETDELGIVYWVDDGLAYALTAATGKDALLAAARLVYRETNP